MIKIERFENKPINSNCYIIYNGYSDRCVIIDPGTENCSNIIPFIKEKKLTPEYVILTHEHFDHIWGVNYLRKEYRIKLISNNVTSQMISDKKKNLSLFYNQVGFECLKPDITFGKEIELEILNEIFVMFCSPGHSDGSICVKVDKFLFTGDTLIKGVKSTTKLPGGSMKKLLQSLQYLSDVYNHCKIILPGHGDACVLKEMSFEDLLN